MAASRHRCPCGPGFQACRRRSCRPAPEPRPRPAAASAARHIRAPTDRRCGSAGWLSSAAPRHHRTPRHCEEQSDEAIPTGRAPPVRDCFASLAMTTKRGVQSRTTSGRRSHAMSGSRSTSTGLKFAAALIAAAGLAFTSGPAPAAEPIKIGFGMGLTGGLAAMGKAALVSMKIWEEEVNAKGGLLGRPVKLIYYDDQSNPATVPGIFTKLLGVDKVDIVMGDYGTNLLAPAMPIVIQHKMTFFALFGLDVNKEFKYDRYFSMALTGGPDPSASFSEGFFELAAAQNPKPKTLAIIAADAEFPHNAAIGARKNAKKAGLQVVYDKTYPPATTDYTPIV